MRAPWLGTRAGIPAGAGSPIWVSPSCEAEGRAARGRKTEAIGGKSSEEKGGIRVKSTAASTRFLAIRTENVFLSLRRCLL